MVLLKAGGVSPTAFKIRSRPSTLSREGVSFMSFQGVHFLSLDTGVCGYQDEDDDKGWDEHKISLLRFGLQPNRSLMRQPWTSFCRQLKPGKNFYISNQMNTVRHRDSFCPRNQAGRYDSGSGPAAAGPGFSGFPHGNGKRMHPQRFPGPVPGTGPCVSANS